MRDAEKLFGAFVGCNERTELYDTIALTKWPEGEGARERELAKTRWLDYRRLHFVQATYLFAREYALARDRATVKYIDMTGDPWKQKNLKEDVFLGSLPVYRGVIKGRQTADELGIPYDFYLNRVMEFSMEFCGFVEPPSRRQLFTEDMAVFAYEQWQETVKARMFWPKDPYYLLSNDAGTADQVACRAWIMDRIAERPYPEYTLATALFGEAPMLSVADATARFGEDIVARARKVSG